MNMHSEHGMIAIVSIIKGGENKKERRMFGAAG